MTKRLWLWLHTQLVSLLYSIQTSARVYTIVYGTSTGSQSVCEAYAGRKRGPFQGLLTLEFDQHDNSHAACSMALGAHQSWCSLGGDLDKKTIHISHYHPQRTADSVERGAT
jgi:hypothetical protein